MPRDDMDMIYARIDTAVGGILLVFHNLGMSLADGLPRQIAIKCARAALVMSW